MCIDGDGDGDADGDDELGEREWASCTLGRAAGGAGRYPYYHSLHACTLTPAIEDAAIAAGERRKRARR